MNEEEKQIKSIQEKFGLQVKIDRHVAISSIQQYTTITSQLKLNGYIVKIKILKEKKKGLYMIILDQHNTISNDKIGDIIGVKNLRTESSENVEKLLGVNVNSLTPLALINDKNKQIDVYIDQKLKSEKLIHVHPLVNTLTVSLSFDQLFNFIQQYANACTLSNFDIGSTNLDSKETSQQTKVTIEQTSQDNKKSQSPQTGQGQTASTDADKDKKDATNKKKRKTKRKRMQVVLVVVVVIKHLYNPQIKAIKIRITRTKI